jgi:hypothetical protein
MERYKPKEKLNGHALDQGIAAGILFVAPDGEVLLLRRGSQEENYAGHWALPGGKAEEGETPEQAADREAREEIGGKPVGQKKLLDKTTTPTGMVFHTFSQPVEAKFVPKLNGEHSGYCWSSLDQLPQPLHPAVAKTIQTKLGESAEDMSEADWDGLAAGLAKWLSEEREEAEHAEDDTIHRPVIHDPYSRAVEGVDENQAHDAKLQHDEVQYGPGKPKSHCSICEYYLKPDHCQLVNDPIEAQGWCKLFTKEQIYAVEINRDYDGPWISCMSKDGQWMYVNRNVPETVDIHGQEVDVDEDLLHHEVPELEEIQKLLAEFEEEHGRKPKTEEKKQLYLKAHHGAGTPSERQYCKERGIDWDALSAWYRGQEAKIAKLKVKYPPPDADVRPIPHKHGDLEIALDAQIYPKDLKVGDRIWTNQYGYIVVEKVFPFDPKYPNSQLVETSKGRRDFTPDKLVTIARDSKAEPEHTLEIQYDGDFDMAGLLRTLWWLGQAGASRNVDVASEDNEIKGQLKERGYQTEFGWDGDGADKIYSATIDGMDILKDGAEDAEFNEEDHPRKGGKFAKKGESSAGASEPNEEREEAGGSGEGERDRSATGSVSHSQKVKAFFKQPNVSKTIAKSAGDFVKRHAKGATEHAIFGQYMGAIHAVSALAVEQLGASVPEAAAISVAAYAVHTIADKLGFGPEKATHLLIKVGQGLISSLLGAHEVGKMKEAHAGQEEGDAAPEDAEVLASVQRFVKILEKTPAQELMKKAKPPKEEQPAHDEAKWIALDHFLIASRGTEKFAFDKSVREYDADGRLHVTVANISKANVCPYLGKEIPDEDGTLKLEPEKIYQLLRPAAELEKAAPTFNGIPVLREHIPVSADDHQPDEVIGATGTDAEFVDPYLRNSLVIWSKDDIDDIKSGEKRELSCGYRYKAIMEPGEYKGVPYQGRMVQIVANHLAICREGRAGADIRIGDKVPEALRWAAIEEAILGL